MAAPTPRPSDPARNWRDRIVAAGLFSVFFAMVGAAYAAVPLYKLICQSTGINGATQRAPGTGAARILAREVTIHFDANTGAGMPWEFKPDVEHMTVHVGETAMAFFSVQNTSDRTVSGSAVYNVTPEITGLYFNKIQCFCFNVQTLKAGERAEMPVIFYVDPGIVNERSADDVRDITLSYTFFETKTQGAPGAAASTTPAVKTKGS